MKLLAAIVCISLGISTTLLSATIEGEQKGGIRVVRMKPTPEPDEVEVRIAFPEQGEVKTENPVKTQLRLEAFGLGFDTPDPRAREIRDNEQGQAVHIIIDGKHHLDINEAIDDIAENQEIDFDQTLEATIPYNLTKGIHVLRAFPVRSYGECLKGPSCFDATYFYFGTAGNKPSIDLSKPYLTYNSPEGEYKSSQPILLDFYVTNTQLSQDGYKVRLTIDGSDKRILTEWVPYYIYGLKKGSHTIKLELLSPQGGVLPPLFDDLHQTIVVK